MTPEQIEKEFTRLRRLICCSSGAAEFTLLTDGPGDFTGHAGEAVRVNLTEDALEYFAAAGSGTVTDFVFTDGNGVDGTVSTSTTVPTLSLAFTPNGILKSNGTAISAAVSGTDYLAPNGSAALLTSFPTLNQNTTGTASNVTGIVSLVNGGTGAALSDPGANTAMVWDDTTSAVRFAILSGLTYDSGTNTLTASGGGMTNPLTTTGDIIYSSSGTTPDRLGIGAANEFLKSNGTTPEWDSINIVVTGVGTGEPVLYDLGTDILYHRSILGSSLIGVATVTDDIVITLDSTVSTASNTQTLTNKRITARYDSTTSSATPTINTDNVDVYELTAQAVDITSFTTNLSGTPTIDQTLHIIITGTAARAITWGASFESSTVALPTTTVSTNRLDVFFVWTGSIWRCGGTW